MVRADTSLGQSPFRPSIGWRRVPASTLMTLLGLGLDNPGGPSNELDGSPRRLEGQKPPIDRARRTRVGTK